MKVSQYVTLALSIGSLVYGSAQAQTMVDTAAAIGVSNTLNSVGGPSVNVVPQVRDRLDAILEPRNAAMGALMQDAAATGTASTTTTAAAANTGAVAATTATATPPAPLTPAQTEELRAAYQALEKSSPAQARQGFERLIAQNYRHPEAHFGLALTLISQGQLEGARFELNQLMALAPDRFEGPFNLGVLAVQAGQYAEALAFFQQAATLARAASADPDTQLYVLEALASEQGRAADYAGLRQTLGEMLTLAPKDPALTLRLAQAQTLSGEGVAALPTTYDALGNAKTQGSAALLLSDIYEAQGLPERGLSELDAVLPALTDDSERARVQLRRAHFLDMLGQTAQAVSTAEESVRLNNQDATALAQLGDLRRRSGNTAGALEAYRQAATLQPKNADYRTELAVLRLGLGRYADARRDANMALQMNSTPVAQARAQLVLGLLDYRSDRYASASTALRASAATLPDAETFLWLGLSEYHLGNYAAAAEALGESVRLSPDPMARRNLGSALLASGKTAEAETVLLQLVTEAPGDAEAWYLLGLTRRTAGKAAEARQAFQSAAALGNTAARGALR